MQAFRRIIDGLINSSSSSDDEDDDNAAGRRASARGYNDNNGGGGGNDEAVFGVDSSDSVVLSMNSGTVAHVAQGRDSDSDDVPSSSSSDESDAGGSLFSLDEPLRFSTASGGGGGVGGSTDGQEHWRMRLPPVLRGNYYAELGAGFWQGESGAEHVQYALEVYQRFRDYSPMARSDSRRPYTELDLIGLEYLLVDAGRHRYTALPFSDICLNGSEPAIAFPLNKGCLDTFVVSRTYDYLYGRLIEDALLRDADEQRLPLHMREASHNHWRARTERFPLCRRPGCQPTRDHDRKACRHQWVVYTRTDSAFYRYCDTVRIQNSYVDYDRHDGSSPNQLRISYHLVNFLCGPLLPTTPSEAATAGVEEYDQWVMQSIEMVDLWNVGTRIELNRNRTFASDELPDRPLALLSQSFITAATTATSQEECTTAASRTENWDS